MKYIVVGGSGAVLDIATLILFKEFFHWLPVVAVAVNQIIVLAFNFTLNKYWSFQNRDFPHYQLVRFAFVFAGNYLFSIAFMYVFNSVFRFPYIFVRLVTIILSVSWNFLLYKNWVYRTRDDAGNPS